MNQQVSHFAQVSLTEQMRSRLAALGVAVAALDADGLLHPIGEMRPIERLIMRSAAFAAALRHRLPELMGSPGQAVCVWPGVRLVALPRPRRRRHHPVADNLVVAMLLSHELIESDQIRLLCDQGRVDYVATISQIEAAALFSDSEAHRLALALSWMREDSTEMDRQVRELHSMSQHLAESYEELSLLYKLSSNMTVNQPPVNFLHDACHEMQQVLGLRWMALLLSERHVGLGSMSGQMFTAGESPFDRAILNDLGRHLMNLHHAQSEATVIDDPGRLGIPRLSDHFRDLLVVPLLRGSVHIGVLFGSEKIDGSQISSVDSKLCASLASSMAIFLQNMILFDDTQAMFMGTLRALTNSIDAKDSYTHGHSERVALMSRLLAEAAGMDQHSVERVYIAGLIHDVGKIGVPEAVLCKPGRLTLEEFELIKQHPEIGSRILADIRQMRDLVPGVLHHHERWDGKGYPYGLGRTEIPIYGRVIGLCDAFDAMSTDRTYRQALSPDRVLAEIKKCAGSQFDPELAELFLTLDFTPFANMVVKHRSLDRPASGGEDSKNEDDL